MKQRLAVEKLERKLYELGDYSDKSMCSLYLFLTDGLELDSCLAFLQDKNRTIFGGNVCFLDKKKENVLVSIDENIFPDLEVLDMPRNTLTSIIQEWDQLTILEVPKIEIILENGSAIVRGG